MEEGGIVKEYLLKILGYYFSIKHNYAVDTCRSASIKYVYYIQSNEI